VNVTINNNNIHIHHRVVDLYYVTTNKQHLEDKRNDSKHHDHADRESAHERLGRRVSGGSRISTSGATITSAGRVVDLLGSSGSDAGTQSGGGEDSGLEDGGLGLEVTGDESPHFVEVGQRTLNSHG